MSGERDPRRLSEAAPDSPLGRLMASAARDLPTEQELAQLAARLDGVLEPMPAPPVGAPGSSLLVKVGAAVGVAALIIAGVWAVKRPRAGSPAPAAAVSAPAAVVASPSSSSASNAPSAPPAASAPPSPVLSAAPKPALLAKQPSSEAPKQAAEGPSEPALLEQARRSLSSSPATALALTGQHAARFPHGVLAQEREVIAIEALRRLGRSAEADQRAAAFARAFPGSAHQRMVEDASPK